MRIPAVLWALFAIQTAVVALWPGFLLDTFVDRLVAAGARNGLTGAFARLGAREVLIPLALSAGAVLSWRRRSVAPLALLIGSYLLVAGVTSATKVALARPQPLPLPGVPGRSFPSGHAAQATVVFGAVALLARRSRRAIGLAIAVVGVVSVALLLRRAHWLSDMGGGVTLGLACLLTVDAVLAGLRRARWGSPVA